MRTNSSPMFCVESSFPITIKAFIDQLGLDAKLYYLNPSIKFYSIVPSDNAPINSNCLFIPYQESDYECKKAVQHGALAILTDHVIGNLPCIVVPNMSDTLFRINQWLYSMCQFPAIMVAGSVGKTTLKRMVSCVLNTEKKAFCLQGNYNTMHGLCFSLQKIKLGTDLIVQEVDEKRKNSTRDCSKILKPDLVLLTNIAESHLDSYGSMDALTESFRGVTAGMDENGIVVINLDDKNSVAANFDRRIVSVGINNTEADCVATDIRESRHGIEFNVRYKNEAEHIRLSVHGIHNVYNSLMAYVVGRLKGISITNIKKGLLSFRNTGIRQNICKLGKTLVYADCYNSSATSVHFALLCFDSLPSGGRKKVAVLGDIAEIEHFEEDTYQRIASDLNASNIDVLVTCGIKSEMIHSFITRDMQKKHTRNKEELNQYLEILNRNGGGNYLFKASRVMELEKCIQSVFPNHYKRLNGCNSSLKVHIKQVPAQIKRRLNRWGRQL